MSIRFCAWAGVALALLMGCNGDRGSNRSRMASPPKVTPLASRFNTNQDFAFVLPQLAPVVGVGGVRASQCGVCHRAVAREWQATTHRAALSDLQYQAELFKDSSPRWLCLNCHIPVQNQRRHLVTGLTAGNVLRPALVKNPGFDAAMQAEAITCATCHVRPDAKGRSVVIGTRGNPAAPHPVRADRKGLRNVCLRCHDPKGERLTPMLVCWFKTREEAAEGTASNPRDCVDCHMPAVRRQLATGFTAYPQRKTHRHHWVGGGVPKRFTGYAGLLRRGYHSGLAVTLKRAERSGGSILFEAELVNRRAGHWLPTADPERHLLLLATLRGPDGRRLGRGAVRRGRIGQVWKWSPRAQKVSDNRLRPDRKRRWAGTFKAAAAAGAVTLELKIWHVRLTSKNAAHMRKARVRPDYVPGLRKLLKRMERHYPMATLVYREVVALDTGKRTRSTVEQLLRSSAAEQRVPLSKRDY